MASLKFCSDCSNMLYPREDRIGRRLLLACRNCDHQEEADNCCVYRHEVTHIPSEQTMVIADLSSDPTLPRTEEVPCPKCDRQLAVYFQSQSRHPDTRMILYYVCCNQKCQHRWQS
ncbi:DNA-directed RNA polymerase II core subunit rpb9 [Coemansia thaxteri]|nr:DNA-directed RNA polymerase II core subunit rpb9 [Coemansia thaxteri]KAJ2473263.1 DNA-directed RNA polymerase II core subunit rpb9 [Coemansia sp. RSA 2322]KAJ2484718.1 DNA-directed RNA polymerase II core subunit rpb9 [Coemansia sp. RSA 2320]